MRRSSKPEIAPDKAAIYIRWSTEDQSEGTTLDVQMDGCRHYVMSQGWRVRDELIFIDDGYSGSTLQRPALSRLRELVRQGEVECVVVYKLDRLSRSVADTARLVMDEWEEVCSVKSAREPIDTSSQAGKMFFYTLMNFAEWERSVIRDRTFSGRVRRAQEGRTPGIRMPYGYVVGEDGKLEVVPHEAPLVRRIFEEYLMGAGLLAIVNRLNREGIPFRYSGSWKVTTLSYILSNRAYLGELVLGKQMANPRFKKRTGEKQRLDRDEPLVVVQGVYPQLISLEEFDRIQTLKRKRPCASRGGGGRSMASDYLLTGLIRCGMCGGPMVGHYNNPRIPDGRYYACSARRERGTSVCAARAVRCRVVDSQVVDNLLGLYETEEARRLCHRSLVRDTRQQLESARAELAETRRMLNRVDERVRRVVRDYSSEQLTITEYRELRAALEEDGQGLRARQESLVLSIRSHEASEQDQGILLAQVEQLQTWEQLQPPQRKHLLRQFIQRVVARRDEADIACEITWKVPVEGAPSELMEETAAD